MIADVSLSHSLQGSHDPLDLPREPLQRGDDFEIVETCCLSKSYMKGSLSVILEFGFQRNALAKTLSSRQDNIKHLDSAVFMLQFNALDSGNRDQWDEELMFIVNVEGVEEQEIAVSSLVRFYPVKYQVADGIASRYFSTLHKRGFKFLSCPLRVGWESGVLMRSFETEFTNNFNPSNIESGMEIVNHIADYQGKIGSQFPISMRTIKKLLSGLEVHVHAGAVAVGRDANPFLYLRDVLVGPFDL